MPGRAEYASEPAPTAEGDTSNDCERKKLPLKNFQALVACHSKRAGMVKRQWGGQREATSLTVGDKPK